MKNLILFFLMFVFCTNVSAQKRDSSVLYKQLLGLYFKSIPKHVPIDTFIVRKADYLPSDLPDLINNHYLKFLSEKEIDNYNGKHYPMIKMFQIKQEDYIYKINLRRFGYDKKEKAWISPAISEYKFHYDSHKQKFVFLGVITE